MPEPVDLKPATPRRPRRGARLRLALQRPKAGSRQRGDNGQDRRGPARGAFGAIGLRHHEKAADRRRRDDRTRLRFAAT
jgi:hypothetical protein